MVCEVDGMVCKGEERVKMMWECVKVKGWCVKEIWECLKVTG